MTVNSRRKLMKTIDAERVKAAIAAAELRTSGEIRVSVARFFWGSVRRAAERAFARLGMAATKDRNGIMFFIVPARKKFVVLGDEGIHARVGQEFWDSLARLMSERFRKGEFTEGLVEAIGEAGRQLAAHFPYDAAVDVNELADDVDFGGR
ncbi:MAG TPA: TPM domain-containing protein [Candidatus Aminicenantes bacterium]|nr:TPM domain-containing protein [Candidatus Aminicenantes bacterium]HRY64421.1 TPM domain-containing protein [Candidatus Aminicenantes bacterium]HRZ71334.1 TPM domain-containing protein [Candidatus Aminicenantes bacterium]